MGDQSMGFTTRPPDGYSLPPGYQLEGESGEMSPGQNVTLYFWVQGDRFGPGERDKRKAIRQAWRDHKSGGTDPTAVDGPTATP